VVNLGYRPTVSSGKLGARAAKFICLSAFDQETAAKDVEAS
jgi:hypothetical protein